MFYSNHWKTFEPQSQHHRHKKLLIQETQPTQPTVPAMLLIEGPKFAGFDFHPAGSEGTGEPFYINKQRLVLAPKHQNNEVNRKMESAEYDLHTSRTAKSVWDCSIVLSKYLEALAMKHTGFWKGKSVIELGAGQGLSSFSAAILGAERVFVTDVDSAVPSLQQGAQLNGLFESQVRVQALDWTRHRQTVRDIVRELNKERESGHRVTTITPSSRGFDYILASDVIWVDFLIQPLVDTIDHLMHVCQEQRNSLLDINADGQSTKQSATSGPVLILAHQSRSSRCDTMFFDAIDARGLKRKKVDLGGGGSNDEDAVVLDPKYRKSNLAIWKIWRGK
ncbi:hypothetical protein BG004_001999 [Podila humilis]|nr:hypothetical protein BG004_001999 [Podila humilis]